MKDRQQVFRTFPIVAVHLNLDDCVVQQEAHISGDESRESSLWRETTLEVIEPAHVTFLRASVEEDDECPGWKSEMRGNVDDICAPNDCFVMAL